MIYRTIYDRSLEDLNLISRSLESEVGVEPTSRVLRTRAITTMTTHSYLVPEAGVEPAGDVGFEPTASTILLLGRYWWETEESNLVPI